MYLGNQPALSYTSFAKQDFTTSATTSYTLDNPVANENEIALFINFVRQEPTTAYTASGTSLTLTSATSGSDDMYCVFLGKAVQTVNPPSGSVGLSQLSATGTKDSTTFLRGDNTFATAGGANTPMFFANKTDTQSIPTTTNTKATFNVEVIDTDSAFSSSRFTVPSGEGGKYYFFASAQYSTYADQKYNVIFFYVNGSVATKGINYTSGTSDPTAHVTYIADLSASDYIEVYVRHNLGSDNTLRGEAGEKTTYFGGYKLIG